jgi:hypothetical protein
MRELSSAGRGLEIGPTGAENASKTEKDTKIVGTNSRIYCKYRS